MAVAETVVTVVRRGRPPWLRRAFNAAFDDLVQFSAIQPYASALRAIVDLNTSALRHGKARIRTNGAFHDDPPQKRRPFKTQLDLEGPVR
jgi:hypothetical protein